MTYHANARHIRSELSARLSEAMAPQINLQILREGFILGTGWDDEEWLSTKSVAQILRLSAYRRVVRQINDESAYPSARKNSSGEWQIKRKDVLARLRNPKRRTG